MSGDRLWPEVTSPLARQILEGAFSVVPFKESLSRKADYLPGAAQGILSYREELRTRLRKSGLAQAMVAGQDLLPNIDEVLPQPLRTWELLWKPRSYRQLAAHIVRYLDWYVEPQPHVSSDLTGPRLRTVWAIMSAVAVLCFSPILGLYEDAGSVDMGLLAGCVVIAFVLVVVAFGGSYLNSGRKRVALIDMNAVRVAEFLFYLIDAYGDKEVAPEAAGDLFGDLVTADTISELKLRHVIDRPYQSD
jgi:hypothetical protein